ncbi:MAG TPA: hypothetical protein VFP72_10575 [Kineosporiaceae bacterium]|nr:hypothetical protein [Kineosporiaceae bacterium]
MTNRTGPGRGRADAVPAPGALTPLGTPAAPGDPLLTRAQAQAALGVTAAGTNVPLPVSRGQEFVVVVSLVATGWLMLSSVILPIELTPEGRDGRLWTTLLGLVLAATAAGRLRAPNRRRRSLVVLLLGGLFLLALPWALGYRPGGPVAVLWWNWTLTGALLAALSAAGLVVMARFRTRLIRAVAATDPAGPPLR